MGRAFLVTFGLAAVLVACVAPAGAANVTLYGYINLDAEVIFNASQDGTSGSPGTPPPGGKQNIYRVTSNSTRFGVRGAEPLGSGTEAIFQIEVQSDAANGGGITTTRNTFVGLTGSWGTLRVGYFFAPYYNAAGVLGPSPATGRNTILSSATVWSNSGYAGASLDTGGFAQRVANSVRYDSPDLAGFTGSVQIGGRDDGGALGGNLAQQQRHAYVASASGVYRNGPLMLAAAYERHNNLREGSPANPKLKDDAFELTGAWNFGAASVAAGFERLKYDLAAGGDVGRNYWAISAMANVGPGQLYAAYWRAADGTGSGQCATSTDGITSCPRVGALTLGPDSGTRQWQISYVWPLSQRTAVYAGYTFLDNERNAGYTFGVPGLCTGNQQDAQGQNVGCGDAARPQGLIVGMFHRF